MPRTQSLFDTLYVFENYPGQAQFGELTATCGLEVREVKALEETNYPLALVVVPQDGLKIHLTYDTTRFSEGAIQRLSQQYQLLLERLLDLESVRIDEVLTHGAPPIDCKMPEEERRQDRFVAGAAVCCQSGAAGVRRW